jgi:hypothetical protein
MQFGESRTCASNNPPPKLSIRKSKELMLQSKMLCGRNPTLLNSTREPPPL